MKIYITILLSIVFLGCNLLTTPSPDDTIPSVTETNMKMVWEIPYQFAGSGINASPLILGDSLVIMSAGKDIFAIEQNSGKIRWKYRESEVTCSQTIQYATDGVRIYTTQVEDIRAINISDGSQAWITTMKSERGEFWTNSVLVSGDMLFVSGRLTFYCLNTSTGEIIWAKNILKDRGSLGTPIEYDNSIIVGGGYGFDDTNHVLAGLIGKIFSLNKLNGEMNWSVTGRGDGGYEKLAIDNGIVFAGSYLPWSSGSFEARNASTGELVWTSYTLNEAWSYNDCIVVGDKIIANSRLGNTLFAFNKNTGSLAWRITLAGFPLQEKQCYYNGFVYITQDGKLYIINPNNGAVEYSLKPKGRELITIAVGNKKVFVCGTPTLQCYETYKP